MGRKCTKLVHFCVLWPVFGHFLRRIAVFIVRVRLQSVTNRYTRLVFKTLSEAQQASDVLLNAGRQVLNNFSGAQK
jgi:hypothetical protein